MAESDFFRLNQEYLRELREYLERERTLRAEHQSRITAILAEMQRLADNKPPPE